MVTQAPIPPPEASVQVDAQLLLGTAAAAADVTHALVFPQHRDQLPLVAVAEVGQDGGVGEVTRSLLVLHEALHNTQHLLL